MEGSRQSGAALKDQAPPALNGRLALAHSTSFNLMHQPFQGHRPEMNRRRDGSQASKAKSNKTIDYECVFMNHFDPLFRMRSAYDPSFKVQTVLPPLEQYERYITQMPVALTKYINRRRCEDKQSRDHECADLSFCRYNPDGRFLLVGSNLGIVYVYNSFDFSFHYQYLVQARNYEYLSAMCFLPNNSNACYIANNSGSVYQNENLLHYDITMNNMDSKVFPGSAITAVNASSCGQQIVCASNNGCIATLDTHRKQRADNIDKIRVFDGYCNDAVYQQFGKQLIVAVGDRICMMDQRIRQENCVVVRAYYRHYAEDEINHVAMHAGGNLLAATGSDGCRIFDLRNLSSDSYRCLYQVRPRGEIAAGTAVTWHPLYNDVLAVGDNSGCINFYDLKFSTSGYGFEQLFEEEPATQFFKGASLQPEDQQQAQLYSIGHIQSAHKTGRGVAQPILDIDIHSSGNQMATTGKDKDVRFWTYPGAGNLHNDVFHGGSIDPADPTYQFNQSHKELQTEQFELDAKIKDIEKMARREGEDIFSREEVQLQMKQYVSTADDRQREAEEADFLRDRECAGRRI